MNQDERRFDFHGLGAALKRAREEKGWTQAYVAELVDRDSRTIMNIENKGQYNGLGHATSTFLISKFFCSNLAPISRNAFLISKNRLFLAND